MASDLIFAIYVDVKDMPTARVREVISTLSEKFSGDMKEGERFFIFPIREGQTKMECINPRQMQPDEFEIVKSRLEALSVQVEESLKQK